VDINHVAHRKAALNFDVINVAFRGNTIAMNLSTAINTKLKIDTMVDASLKKIPTLHAVVA